MAHSVTAPNPRELPGIGAETQRIHHDVLYAAYVKKRNEIEESLLTADAAAANQIYSAYRGLKEGETFAANGMILHELLFSTLGGDGEPEGTDVKKALESTFGSWEGFIGHLTATAMAARGWAVLAYDPSDGKLHLYAGDAQNHGGVWGSTPVLGLDVYEHAYFLDHGSDRKAYVAAFLKNIDWNAVDERFRRALGRS